MARPVVEQATEDVYARLEEFRREADVVLDFPLLRYVSLVGDQLGDLAELVDRIDFRTEAEGGEPGDTSDLVDPAVADVAWLPWLAQVVGVRVGNLDTGALRDAIGGAVGSAAATKPAVAAAASSALTGTRYVLVRDHQAGSGAGGEYDLTVFTLAGETPDTAAVLLAVTNARAKPAGVRLWHAFGGATWAQIEAAYPTWAARNGKTWANLQLDAI